MLPARGDVPQSQFLAVDTQPRHQRQSSIGRLWESVVGKKVDHADWIRNRRAVRFIVRTYLCAHIQSKLQVIAYHLNVERLKNRNMDVSTSVRLGIITRELEDYIRTIAPTKTLWMKLLGWLWFFATSLFSGYLVTIISSGHKLNIFLILTYLLIYIGLFAILFLVPLFDSVVLGGFRWKRLILLGQTGDVNLDISPSIVLRWNRAPSGNTYKSENHLFGILGFKKPNELPWDLVLSPRTIFLTIGALILLLFTVGAFIIAATKLDWSLLIGCIFLALFIACLYYIFTPIRKIMRDRAQHNAC